MNINTVFEVWSHQCVPLLTLTSVTIFISEENHLFIYYQMECLQLDEG